MSVINNFLVKLLLPICTLLAAFSHAASSYSYTIDFKGTSNKEVLQKLQQYSELYQKVKAPPVSLADFQKRVKEDGPKLVDVLRSMGFYDGQVSLLVESNASSYKIIASVYTGKLYRINSFRILPSYDFLSLSKLKVKLGEPAHAEYVLQAEKELIKQVRNLGYLEASFRKKEYLVDQKKKQLNITLHLDLGPKYYVGKTTISGNKAVKTDFILDRIKWREGEVYSSLVEQKSIRAIESTGLFNLVEVFYPMPSPQSHVLPMHVHVTENKHRTVGAGVSYTFDEGYGVSLNWQNRNFTGEGDTLSLESNFAKKEYSIGGSYRIPYWLGNPKEDLLWSLQLDKEKNTAYDEKSASISALIDRRITNKVSISYGPKLLTLTTTDAVNNGSYSLISFPLLIKWRSLNSLIVPTKGCSLSYQVLPHKSFQGRGVNFITQKLKGKILFPLFNEGLILSASSTAGSILGATRSHIPTPLRLYAGSFTTLPGYKYNSVSPLDSNNKPTGGLSMLIAGCSATLRLLDNLGFSLGYSAGNVYAQKVPKLSEKWLKSWTTGLTYYTPVGPLSVDAAFPLNRRPGIDSKFQIYVNLGGSF